jgi:hypothetical protein
MLQNCGVNSLGRSERCAERHHHTLFDHDDPFFEFEALRGVLVARCGTRGLQTKRGPHSNKRQTNIIFLTQHNRVEQLGGFNHWRT